MDMQGLRIFAAVVDQRGFGRGAEAAHVTQSAASQAIRKMEDELGTALLLRARPPQLTPAGRRLYEHARDLLARDAVVRRDVDALRKGGRGLVQLGASQALSRELLPRLVLAFHAAHPEVALHLETLPSREIIRVVARGAPRARARPVRAIHGRARGPSPGHAADGALCRSRSAATRARPRGKEEALRRLPLVTSHLETPGARPGSGQLRDHFRTVWEVHSLDLRLELVRAGVAVGYLPESTVAERSLRRQLTPVAGVDFGVIERRFALFHAARRSLTEPAAAFLEMARALRSVPEEER